MLLERDTELACVRTALADAHAGIPSVLLLTGPLGIGRTALLLRLPELVGYGEVRVLRANAAAAETDFAFGVVRQLLDSLAVGTLHSPDIATHEEAHDAMYDTAGYGMTAESLSEAILQGPHTLLADLGSSAGLLILVDDLQWADAPSLRWLAHLTKRLRGQRVVLVCALRDGDRRSGHPLVREIADTASRTLRLAPLSPAATRALIRERWGVPGHEEYARTCHGVSGGNPLILTSVLRDMARQGLAPVPEHCARIRALRPPELRERLTAALRTQPRAVRELAAAIVAFGGHGDPGLVARLAGLDDSGFAAARRALGETGLLAGGRTPGFVHPVVQDAVVASLSAAERERGHTAAADLLYGSGRSAEEVADHLLAGAVLGRPWTVPLLRSAAGDAVRRGESETAARYLRRAVLEHRAGRCAEGGGAAERGGARLLVELATVEREFDTETAERHIARAIPLLTTPGDRAVAALRIPPALLGVVSRRAGDLLRAAAGELGPADRLAGGARESALRLEARLRHHGHENPAELASAVARLRTLGAEPPLDTAAERELAVVLLCSATLTGGVPAADAARLAGRVLEREPAGSAGAHTVLPLAVITLFAAESVGTVGSWLAVEQQTRRQNATGAAGVFLFAGWALVLAAQGRPTQAREYAERALDLADTGLREISAVVLCSVALELRDPALSERILSRAREDRPAGLASTAALQILRASVDAQRGLWAAALDTLLACGRGLDGSGWRNSSLFPWRPHAIGLHQRLGDTGAALGLAEEEYAWAVRWGAPAGIGRALRLRGRLQGARGVGLLREAVDVLRNSSYELELARTLVLLGQRLGPGAEAEAALREGGALAASCGAPWLVERAGQVLGRAAAPRTAPLTRGERRVTALVNRGLSNQEIAGELGVSSRAVEKHLTNSYRKLGISGRHELAEALPQ
ncbi:ATP-binding protein [Streptomyces sp. NPDC087658]|uniref:ATP-binding protein n=1 Tax=Streptomyces sp. NPDC087658 TaxID=3365800 RepID=UPI00381FDF9C